METIEIINPRKKFDHFFEARFVDYTEKEWFQELIANDEGGSICWLRQDRQLYWIEYKPRRRVCFAAVQIKNSQRFIHHLFISS